MGTMTITEFLLARIAERESVARDMQHQARVGRPFFRTDLLAGGTGIRELIDPARVMAECEAKRRMVEEATHPQTSSQEGYDMLRYLAEVYADHPDYSEEWRP